MSAQHGAYMWVSVADAAAGTLDSLYLVARSVSDASVADSGWVYAEVVKPNLPTDKSVSPRSSASHPIPGSTATSVCSGRP